MSLIQTPQILVDHTSIVKTAALYRVSKLIVPKRAFEKRRILL